METNPIRTLRGALWGALLAATTAAAQGGAAGAPVPVSLQGTLVDVHCYALRRAAGADRAAVQACRDGAPGQPLGLLVRGAAGERLYVLATPPLQLAPHLGMTARLEGVRSPLGEYVVKPESLEVRAAPGWRPVALLPDM